MGFILSSKGMEEKTQDITFNLRNIKVSALRSSIEKIALIRGNNGFLINEENISIDTEKNTLTVKNIPPHKVTEVHTLIEFLDLDSSEWKPTERNLLSFGNEAPNTPYIHNPHEEIAEL